MDFAARYGPWALIAGASEGTGASFARQLAARGLDLVLIARREAPLAALAEEITREHGVKCVTASIDLATEDGSAQVVAAAAEREVGLFVNNAGGDPNSATFLDGAMEDWDRLVMLDTVTVMRNCHHFARAMARRGRGGIILVGSGACYGGLSGKAVYSGAKAFDLCFGEALWAELRGQGVDVLNLILGQTDTPEYRRVLAECGLAVPDNLADPDEVAELGLARLPHGPVCNWGSADEESGMAPNSPAERRARIIAIERASMAFVRKS